MYIQTITKKGKNGKVYKTILIRESYREGGKVKQRTLANITHLPKDLIEELEKLLKGKRSFSIEGLNFHNGKSFVALVMVREILKELGIMQALGKSKQGKLAMVQIASRVIEPASRHFIANEWQDYEDIEGVFGIKNISEDQLYKNLDWLSEHQSEIEESIFKYRYKGKPLKTIFLYDVTSSYLEGEQNELAAYGYNRDKKRGKKQIVIGLLVDSEGYPVSIEVFKGNTSDFKTVSRQLEKLKERFGVEHLIFVGDKGMIKSAQIDEIQNSPYKWDYLTSISKAQIRKLLKEGVFQLELFEDEIVEVEWEGVRYLLRRNKFRQQELQANREAKIKKIQEYVKEQNIYLKEHKRAKEEVALKRVKGLISRLKMSKIIKVSSLEREIQIEIDQSALKKAGELDGCYVIKTEAKKEILNSKTAHDRYKALSEVETAFRTMKTGLEELRPIYVRKASRTRGHVFVVMLAYMVIKYLEEKLKNTGISPRVAIFSLEKIQWIQYEFKGHLIKTPPKKLNTKQQKILQTLGLKITVDRKKIY